jgi:hypothetical protein
VVFDARGHFKEPHGKWSFGIGTFARAPASDLWGASITVEGDVWALGAAIIIVGIVAVAAVVY